MRAKRLVELVSNLEVAVADQRQHAVATKTLSGSRNQTPCDRVIGLKPLMKWWIRDNFLHCPFKA